MAIKLIALDIDGTLVLADLTAEDLAFLIEGMEDHLGILKMLREDEIEKNGFSISIIKIMYDQTDDDLRATLEAMDAGTEDIDKYTSQAPFDIEGLEKVEEFTREIQKQQAAIEELQRIVVLA